MLRTLRDVLLLLALAAACQSSFASASRSVAGALVGPEGFQLPPGAVVALRGADGHRRTTLPRFDGTFKFFNIPDGVYYVDVEANGYQFLPLKVSISDNGASIKASSPDMPSVTDVPYPLRVPVVGLVNYFEARQGFNIIAWLKTPMGAMVAFSLGSLVLMPMLKVDPEEYKAMMEEKQKLSQSIRGTVGGGSARKND